MIKLKKEKEKREQVIKQALFFLLVSCICVNTSAKASAQEKEWITKQRLKQNVVLP